MELGLQGADDELGLAQLRALCVEAGVNAAGLVERLSERDGAVEALDSLSSYAPRLFLGIVSGRRTGLEDLRERVLAHAGERPLVVVDYLQKVRAPGEVVDEDERVTFVVEGLKDLALETDLPCLAIVASDKEGVGGGRTRLRHLRGSTALAYEADVALLLNDKFNIVARHHLVYGTTNAEQYQQWAVCSIEKNRSGSDDIDLEFRKHFEQGRFDPSGHYVAEQLVDDRIHTE